MAAPSVRHVPSKWGQLLDALRSWEEPYYRGRELKQREKEQEALQEYRQGTLDIQQQQVDIQRQAAQWQREADTWRMQIENDRLNLERLKQSVENQEAAARIDQMNANAEKLRKEAEKIQRELEIYTPEYMKEMAELELETARQQLDNLGQQYLNFQALAKVYEAQAAMYLAQAQKALSSGEKINWQQYSAMVEKWGQTYGMLLNTVAGENRNYETFRTTWENQGLDPTVFEWLNEDLFNRTSLEVIDRAIRANVSEIILPTFGMGKEDMDSVAMVNRFYPDWNENEFGLVEPTVQARGGFRLFGSKDEEAPPVVQTGQDIVEKTAPFSISGTTFPIGTMGAIAGGAMQLAPKIQSGIQSLAQRGQKPQQVTPQERRQNIAGDLRGAGTTILGGAKQGLQKGKEFAQGLFGQKEQVSGGQLNLAGSTPAQTGIEILSPNTVFFNKTAYTVNPQTNEVVRAGDGAKITDPELVSLILNEYMKQRNK